MIGKGKAEGIGDHGAAEAFITRSLEHGLAEVRAGDLGVRAGALDGKGEVAAAGGEIEEGGGAPGGDDRGGAAAPKEVEAAGEEVIGEIVPSCDGREERMNELWLLQRRSGYLRGQMTRIKKARQITVRIERATRKL